MEDAHLLDDCALAAFSSTEEEEAMRRSVLLLAFSELLVDTLALFNPLALVVVVRFYFKTAHTTHVGILDQNSTIVQNQSVETVLNENDLKSGK